MKRNDWLSGKKTWRCFCFRCKEWKFCKCGDFILGDAEYGGTMPPWSPVEYVGIGETGRILPLEDDNRRRFVAVDSARGNSDVSALTLLDFSSNVASFGNAANRASVSVREFNDIFREYGSQINARILELTTEYFMTGEVMLPMPLEFETIDPPKRIG